MKTTCDEGKQLPVASELITIDEVKKYLRLKNEDAIFLREIIDSAINFAEIATNRHFSDSKHLFQYYPANSSNRKVSLPHSSVSTVDKIYLVRNSRKKIIPRELYYLELNKKTIMFLEAINADSIIVEYSTGYIRSNFPPALKNAILSHIAVIYDNRDDIQLTMLSRLYSQFREHSL